MIGARPPSPPPPPPPLRAGGLWRRLAEAQDQAIARALAVEELARRENALGVTGARPAAAAAGAATLTATGGAAFGRGAGAGGTRPGWRAGRPAVAIGAAATTVAIAAAVALFAWAPRKPTLSVQVGSATEPAAAPVPSLVADARADLPLRFSDGSAVTFQAGSAGRMASLTSSGAEIILERGALEARVVHAASTAWVIHAGPFRVRVTGTRFAVAWRAETLDLALYEGSVVVDGAVLGAGVPLQAGRRLTVASGVVRIEPFGPATATSPSASGAGMVEGADRTEDRGGRAARTVPPAAGDTHPSAGRAAGDAPAADGLPAGERAGRADPRAVSRAAGDPAEDTMRARTVARLDVAPVKDLLSRRAGGDASDAASPIDRADVGAGVPAGVGGLDGEGGGGPAARAIVPGKRRAAAGSGHGRAARTASPSAPESEGWLALAERGHYPEALARAKRLGWNNLCRRLDAHRLLTLADVARYSGAPRPARRAFEALARRFPRDRLAGDAVFSLGRMAFEAGRPGEAAGWFRRYGADWPHGPLGDEAAGRLVESEIRMDDTPAAREAARAYLARAPHGAQASLARGVLADPTDGAP